MAFRTKREKAANYIKNRKVRTWVKNKIADEKAGVDTSVGREGYVYIFSLGDGYYKIGQTTDVLKRQKALQAGNPHIRCIWSARVRDRYSCESCLHKAFKKKKVQREVFELTQGEIRHADSLADKYR